jgi:hypothetical protein
MYIIQFTKVSRGLQHSEHHLDWTKQVYMGEDLLQKNKDWIYINSTFMFELLLNYFYQLRHRKICQLRRYKRTQRNCSIEIIQKIEEQITNWSYLSMEKQNAAITWTELNCISCMQQCSKVWCNNTTQWSYKYGKTKCKNYMSRVRLNIRHAMQQSLI